MPRDRIKSLRRVRAGDLQPHPKNWRRHPEGQRAALAAILEEVGFADALLVREVDKGLQIIDGHLRADLDPDQKVPCLVLDVNEEEAEKLLATFDPLAGLAETDAEQLAGLMEDIEFESPDLDALVNGLLGGVLPADADGKEFDESAADDVIMVKCPECGHEFPR